MNTENIINALSELGNNAYDIANNLNKMGIKGFRSESFHCPVAQFLRSKNISPVTVCTWDLNFQDVNGKTIIVQLPRPVTSFIERFDAGDFDYLQHKVVI